MSVHTVSSYVQEPNSVGKIFEFCIDTPADLAPF